MALLDALGAHLQTSGVGTLATDIFLSVMPDSPDACILIVEDNGVGPMQTFGATAYSLERPRIRVFCRAARNDYPAARAKAVLVRAALGAIRNQTISGVAFLSVMPTSDFYSVGRDGDDRPVIGVDFSGWVA
ncbi:hypothetical protein UFOVP1296_32 [uncultured Caudovirales phage]|uniref:Uncharacterized protein n=1 Tax=uncultured Caudovirales phage TaxID=2100421 RepID=A0A6J5RNG4_9CAUD|nr:hypothetical protein UFOVP471_62 [uncultured Caudovirales phage]CAB4169436.1 hypothetical protein UFOVP890_32 [uncultured Caudovirales phage]CAB4195736.1 hypothetical protein UFOVP1296_32 [uncultured Caudovirales phage]